jgi:hypothetical protein
MRPRNGTHCVVNGCQFTPHFADASLSVALCPYHAKAWEESGERRRAEIARAQAVLDFVRRLEAEERVSR